MYSKPIPKPTNIHIISFNHDDSRLLVLPDVKRNFSFDTKYQVRALYTFLYPVFDNDFENMGTLTALSVINTFRFISIVCLNYFSIHRQFQ